MANKIYHKHFTHPIFFFILTLFVLESFTTTIALDWSLTPPPTSPGHRTGKCTKKERQALLHFKSNIHYDPQGLLDTWTPGEEEKVASNDCCYWSGVMCNNQSRVTSLDLRDGFLGGKISPSLLNLSYLNYLDLYDNSFNGMIPMFISSMTQLRYLDLGWNDFNGTIPMFIGSMTQLRYLDLSGNRFNGKIPMFIGSMTQLRYLDLGGNRFNGTIPMFIGSMTQLRYLDLGGNRFNGTIPMFIGSMTQLRYLNLGSNDFNGTIPMFIGSMTQLRYLNLGWNDFRGTIPSELGNLTNLQELSLKSLSNCTIENLDWLSHLSQLDRLDMSGTSLGKVDNWVNVILSLKKLSALYLHRCDLSYVMHPYSYVNSSFSSSIVTLYLRENNLNSSMYNWLFPLTSNALVELDLSENMLDGIPKYLGNLCGLTSLYFDGNLIPIKLPDFLSNLSGCTSVTLQYLGASSSEFTGMLSDDIQNFSSLQELDLSNNQLDGTISEKVWQLPKLQTLYASSNLLKGAISENIEKSNILYVYLSNNSLEGVPLEANMSNISSIEYIDLSSCKLGPHFPKWIQTMKNLSGIDLSNTQISDNIPEDFWKTWPSRLTYLNISFNNITGTVTDMLSNFVPVVSSTIDLSSNNFYGHIPNAPSSLARLDLSKNNLSGQIFFLCQIVDGYLSFLDLSHNAFTGPIPDCLWHFTGLEILSLGYNNLSGRLPTSIKFLINLKVLYLYNNNVSGKLPLSLKSLTQLTFLNLGANKFSGYVPGWIGERLSGLYALILSSNKFIGTIPSDLCQLEYLKILDLSINKLQGAIPSCLGNLTSMVQDGLEVSENVHYLQSVNDSLGTYVDHSMIKWQGSVREFGSTIELVKIINLSSNNLTGKIPDKLTDLHKLIALDLSMNALVGEIPSKIGEMKELQILDLSRNNLRGGLPSSMSQMTLLNYLDVSYNNLSGRIPSSTQLQSFDPSRYTGNAGLCGLPLTKYCPGDKVLEGPPVSRESMEGGEGIDDLQRWFYIGGASGFVTGFWMVCIALIVNRRGRHAFFHVMNGLENWVYVKVMVFIAKVRRV
ncbi:putative non-specific serine/threonine protein kinase [Helianthus annuus]|nr:putative non-specific serine/threonine protein kinase [Helianthus annuus]KAJ0778563.1 putative non-specific serine/threonine protein kinase [Helianthus annuus]KAJ0941528.1 putative non-specific serine/threonine protein kinase [Helianthus annuus]